MGNNARKDLFQQWETLLAGLRSAAGELPGLDPCRLILEDALREALETRERGDALQAAAGEASRHLERTLARGRDAASRIRSFLRFCLGPSNHRLTRFGIKPLGKRRKKPKHVDGLAPGGPR